MKGLWGRINRTRHRVNGSFYCPGCRQTVGCLKMETVRISRILFVPVRRRVVDSGLVKCPLCGGVFEQAVTAFSPAVSRAGFKPALVTVMLLMLDVDGSDAVGMGAISRIVAEVTGESLDPEAMALEIERLLAEKDALGDQLRAIAPYLTNPEKRLILESAWRVAHADGNASEKEMALMRRIASLLEVPDAICRRVTGDMDQG